MTFLADVPLLLKNHFLGGFMVPFACETRLVFLKACIIPSFPPCSGRMSDSGTIAGYDGLWCRAAG